MDITSVEFYTIALVVAFTLLGLIVGQKRQAPASTHFATLEVQPTEPSAASQLTLTALDNGNVRIERTGLALRAGETVNLIATVVDDKVSIVEKKGNVAVLGGEETTHSGTATVAFLTPRKWNVRYESQVTGQWVKFQFSNTAGNHKTRTLNY